MARFWSQPARWGAGAAGALCDGLEDTDRQVPARIGSALAGCLVARPALPRGYRPGRSANPIARFQDRAVDPFGVRLRTGCALLVGGQSVCLLSGSAGRSGAA